MGLELVLDSTEIASHSPGQVATQTTYQTALGSVDLSDGVETDQADIQLPTDFLRTPDVVFQPKIYTFTLTNAQTDTISSFPVEPNVERSLLVAALNLLLHRYTQQPTIDLELNFANVDIGKAYTTRIRTQIDDQATVQDYLEHVVTALRASQNQLNGLQLPHCINSPIRQSAIALSFIESGAVERVRPSAAAALRQTLSPAVTDLDLHLIVLRQGQSSQAILRYNAGLFKANTIKRMAGHLQVLLTGMIHHPNCLVSDLPLMTPAEKHQLLVDWSSESLTIGQTPIHQYIESHAAAQPEAIALRFRNQTLTYAALNQRANQLANYLIKTGIKPEDRIAVCVEPALEILIALLGIFKAGAIYVPLDPTHPTERLAAIAADTQPKILLTQAHLVAQLPTIADQVCCLDQDWQQFQTLPTHNPNIEINLEQVAYVVYTSGTTGKPKGVMATYRNLMHYIAVAQREFRFDQRDVMPAIARFTFSITMFELFSPLVAGGTLLILEREHILDFKRMVQTLQQVTVVHMSPSLWRKLLTYIQETGIDTQTFRQLKHVSSGGDMIPADLLEMMKAMFPTAEVYVLYGSSEVSCMGCFYPVPRDRTITKTRVGKPFSNVSIRLLDAQQKLVPIGVVGEVYFSGGGITKGYLNREDLTQEKFMMIDGQRFYRMGDLGRFDDDGNLELLGRADFQIKLRGIRIEPGEIEFTLRQFPGVREAIVVARELGREKALVAYLVLEQQPPAIAEIRQFLQTKLPDYMVPAAFVVLDAMPVNLNQKIDRLALPAPTLADLATATSFVAPRNDYELRLTQIWETLLGISPIGVQDNFFDIGGDSLQIVSLMTQIEREFGKTLPLSTVLTEPTIEQLAAVLKQSKQSDIHQSIVVLRKGGSKPPIFFIHDGEGETLLYRNLALCLQADHPIYGVQPYSRAGFPMLHTRLEEVVAYYLDQIRNVQPHGPYLLTGLCIGGYIAFEIARKLQNLGEKVAMVALIDTADLETPIRASVVTQRKDSFVEALKSSQHLRRSQRLLTLASIVTRKVYNLTSYELQTRLTKVQAETKLKLLRTYLDRGLTLPSFLQNIPVRYVLKFAEQGYVPDALYRGEVVLFRSTQKSSIFDGTEVDDTPYCEIYSDPLLGWEQRVTDGVKVFDVPGGHSSMLQEPNVQVIAHHMQAYINQAIGSEE